VDTNANPSRSLHRVAVLTACVALLPIAVGALVTTLRAGMAFLDWPSSDGHNMLLYPWFRDLAEGNTDKAVEHGHRLAGMLIGLVSIALVVVAWLTEPRRWVRGVAFAVLLSVIAQGILGGARVIQNEQTLAMVHGTFAAVVFAAIGCLALVTGRGWFAAADRTRHGADKLAACRYVALAAPVLLFVQFVLGGFVRHLGTMLHEHLAFAVLAFLAVLATVVVSLRTGERWLRSSAWLLLAVVLVQIVLGAGSWVNRFGFGPAGYVAVEHSLPQVLFRTSHAVVGVVLFMLSVVHAVRVLRLARFRREVAPAADAGHYAYSLHAKGRVG
jgi:cytochrome c oxidase assembly protein subunit 15